MSQNCSNCYNGCVQIVSDQCVMYTGIDVPLLGIKKGDSLSYVEQAIITFLGSVLDGSGIKINLEEEDYCDLVSQYLLECQEVTALDLFRALVKAACDLQEQINTIEADYTVECLDDVSAGDGTHAIVQAVINKLCEAIDDIGALDTALAELAANLSTNYVLISEINTYIAAYIDSTSIADRYYTRMVPYTAVEYYGTLSNFDITGAGLPDTLWENIYLCNGNNGTPDKRGRVPVGAINGVPGPSLASAVNPASDPTFNPDYVLGTPYGANKTTLSTSQIPSHTHSITTDGDHSHTVIAEAGTDTDSGALVGGVASVENDGEATTSVDGDHTHTLGSTGGGGAHTNIQPVLPCYYIMYIP